MVIIVHDKQELAGCYEVIEIVAEYRDSSGSFGFLLAQAETKMDQKVTERKKCEICLFFLPQLPVVARWISLI